MAADEIMVQATVVDDVAVKDDAAGLRALLRGKRTWRTGAFLLVLLLALPAAWPFLTHPGYWASHDGLFHLYRLLSLESAWRDGHFYPRIFPDFAFGYGFAVLNFYGPLTYYVALALHGLGLSAISAMKATFALSYPLAALAMWWFARDLWRDREGEPNEIAGLLAAAVYTYVPYHMADVQLRGALAESWAFVWWPLLFWATWRLRFWPLVFSLAGLLLTHNLSVILAGLPLLFWGLLALSGRTKDEGGRMRTARMKDEGGRMKYGYRFRFRTSSFILHPSSFKLLSAVLLALASTAFYWLPLVLESRYVWIAQDVGGRGFTEHLAPLASWVTRTADYHYFPNQGVAAEHPLSWAQVALLLVAVPLLPRLLRSRYRVPLLFWGVTFVAVLFLLTPASIPLWKALVFPFGMVQYPWRWLGILALATAMLASAPLAGMSWHKPRPALVTWSVVALGMVAWLAFSSMRHLPWETHAVDTGLHPSPMWQADAEAGQVGATWTAEFLPLTVREQRWALARAPEMVEDAGERTPLRIEQAGSDGFSLWAEVRAEDPGWLTFPRFAYPSMRALVDGKVQPVEPRGIMGLAAVQVPAGEHRVVLDAYPLASWGYLAWLLWIPPALLLLYLLYQHGRAWAVVGLLAGAALFLLPRVTTLVSPVHASLMSKPVAIGEQAQLVDARWNNAPLRSGDTLKVRLLWFNLQRTDQRYVTFVHLTTAGGGALVAQDDGEPNMRTVPTSRWEPGQMVEDLHVLALPEGLPPGNYELWGGMYRLVDGSAAPIPGDTGGRHLLGKIEVGE